MYRRRMIRETITLWRIHPGPVEIVTLALPATIGRLPLNRMQLVDDDVSREHAVIEDRIGKLTITDRGSRNGVYVNGRRMGVCSLSPGAVLRMGQTVLWQPATRTQPDIEAFVSQHATTTNPLTIVGEVGAGKRTLAKRIHLQSQRKGLQLFAEFDADDALLRAASSGTVVVTDPIDPQALLMRAKKHLVRIVMTELKASNRADTGTFELLPLRDRVNELPQSLSKLLGTERTWNADFLEALACHPFPMNFAELVVVCRGMTGNAHGIEALPHSVRAQLVEARSAQADDTSREALHDALSRHKGNVRRISQELGIARGHLYRMLAAFGLNPDAYRAQSSNPAVPLREERRTQP